MVEARVGAESDEVQRPAPTAAGGGVELPRPAFDPLVAQCRRTAASPHLASRDAWYSSPSVPTATSISAPPTSAQLAPTNPGGASSPAPPIRPEVLPATVDAADRVVELIRGRVQRFRGFRVAGNGGHRALCALRGRHTKSARSPPQPTLGVALHTLRAAGVLLLTAGASAERASDVSRPLRCRPRFGAACAPRRDRRPADGARGHRHPRRARRRSPGRPVAGASRPHIVSR